MVYAKGDPQTHAASNAADATDAALKAIQGILDNLGIVVPHNDFTAIRNSDLRELILVAANDGGAKLLQLHGPGLGKVIAECSSEISGYAALPGNRGRGFESFFRDFLAWPDLARRRAPKLYEAISDYLDAVEPGLLEDIDSIQRIGGPPPLPGPSPAVRRFRPIQAAKAFMAKRGFGIRILLLALCLAIAGVAFGGRYRTVAVRGGVFVVDRYTGMVKYCDAIGNCRIMSPR
jgi:hypothetical protein